MSIEGRFYTAQELQAILDDCTRQNIYNIARRQGWRKGPYFGLYYSEDVEPFLFGRGIDPGALPVKSYSFPNGATWAEQSAEFDRVRALMEDEDDL